MRKFAIIAFACLALAACKDEDGRTVVELNYGIDQETDICFADGFKTISMVECTSKVLAIADKDYGGIDFYFLDPQTDLCFAHGYEADANVPCTPEVKKKIAE